MDEEILNFMLTNNVIEKDYSKEFEACEEYTEKLISIKEKWKQLFVKPMGEIRSMTFTDVERTQSRLLRFKYKVTTV